MIQRALVSTIATGLFLLAAHPLGAQIAGHHLPGSWGLQSGTQHPEGLIVAPLYVHYGSDRIVDKDGNELPNPIGTERDVSVDAIGLFGWWVSKYRILGGTWGAQALVPFGNNQVEFPTFSYDTGLGLGDIFVQPVNLGWHLPRADFLATYGFYMPTGSYEPGGTENNGMGMWTHEFGAGTTVFFDAEKRWHFAATGYFEINGTKKDTRIDVGNTLTVEGGLGRSFLEGALSVGAAYYGSWKVSEDRVGLSGELPGLPSEIVLSNKHRVFGLGPEAVVPIAINGRLIALVNARYLWELGARSTLEGQRLVAYVIFPFLANGGS